MSLGPANKHCRSWILLVGILVSFLFFSSFLLPHDRINSHLTASIMAFRQPDSDEFSFEGFSSDDNMSVSLNSGISSGMEGEEDKREVELERMRAFAARETTSVRCWRVIVILVIVAMGILVSTLTFVFLKREDDDDLIDSVSRLHWSHW